jgi:carbon-monoxide dehydrogenase medium subunit
MSESTPGYRRPDTLEETCDLLAEHEHDARLVAGGQSVSLLLRQDLLDPSVIVDVSDLEALDGIRVEEDGVRIGGTTTYAALGDHEVARTHEVFGDAVAVIADEQVRNLGTVGGAVAHADPSLDVLPPLLCLDATVHLAGPDGSRSVAFEDLYTGYMATDLDQDEVIEAITVERPSGPDGSAYEKYATVEGGWATVGVASRLELATEGDRIASARVALAAVADTPVRARAAEEHLEGHPPTADRLTAASERIPADIEPLEDLAGSAAYKESLAVRLGERSLERSAGRASGGESA